ncbi:MAG: NTP transferase domain-containing protein, partial [Actinomycetes bacterium]
PDVSWAREEPPGGGPLAAVAAALRSGPGARPPVVLLAGGDMPAVGAAVPALVAALDEASDAVDAVLLSDTGGRRQVLASAWHRAALEAAVGALGGLGSLGSLGNLDGTDGISGVPLQRILDGVRVLLVPDRWGAARDVDTPADLSAAAADLPKPTVE